MYGGSRLPTITNMKAHGNPQAFRLSSVIVHEMVEISVHKEKRKRFFANMSNYLFVMFYIFGFKLVKILLLL